MNNPASTYRIQFHHEFKFADLDAILPYLSDLGISTIYASPIVSSNPKSMHGYDVTDPDGINPEIGTLNELIELSKKLKSAEMTWLQDIVPNHMAYSVRNSRLMDVFERGSNSEYFSYFDVLWRHTDRDLFNKIMLPVLTEGLKEAVPKINLAFGDTGWTITYGENAYPVSTQSYHLLKANIPYLKEDIFSLIAVSEKKTRKNKWREDKDAWIKCILAHPEKLNAVHELITLVNSSVETKKALLELQNFRFMPWRATDSVINYRRFFTINELICLRMEDEFTFQDYHRLIASLFNQNLVQGIRIDHIDGLFDPATYCRKARTLFGPSCYIIAEKILAEEEDLPHEWPLQGTSGYEFLAEANQLFTDKAGADQLTRFYNVLVPAGGSYADLVYQNKQMILKDHMGGEWNNLVDLFLELNLQGGYEKQNIKQALGAMLISLPVYRIYPKALPLQRKSRMRMQQTFDQALKRCPERRAELTWLSSLFLDNHADKERALQFLNRAMQFTGPLTAKGVEDTTFYSYNALISHDEVGESPSSMALFVDQFHDKMVKRQHASRFSLNATSTHDTKRGEDARLRLNVLTEIPFEWESLVKQWIEQHTSFNSSGGAPSLNDQYFIYQSIIGGFPEDLHVTPEWIDRLKAFILKMVREAKVNSCWSDPVASYEKACDQFIDWLFEPGQEFLASLLPFMEHIDELAMTYSLALVVLKITAPGIPDTYQGCELFNHSFVDPDNRRKVDYELRKKYLDDIIAKEQENVPELLAWLKAERRSGIEKLYVTWKGLSFRRKNAQLFVDGEYLHLEFDTARPHAMAYARVYGDQWVIVVIPQNIEQQKQGSAVPGGSILPVRLILPAGFNLKLTSLFSNEVFENIHELTLGRILRSFPVAILSGTATSNASITL